MITPRSGLVVEEFRDAFQVERSMPSRARIERVDDVMYTTRNLAAAEGRAAIWEINFAPTSPVPTIARYKGAIA
jgi:hypothetical protein